MEEKKNTPPNRWSKKKLRNLLQSFLSALYRLILNTTVREFHGRVNGNQN